MAEHYFDETKRAQRGSWKSFALIALLGSGIVSLIAGFLIFNFYTYRNLSPLQRYYFGQYSKAYLTPSLLKYGRYKILMYQVINPETKKKDWHACLESELLAKTNDDGNVDFDKNRNPLFYLKNGVKYEKDSFVFYTEKIEHKWAYNFFSNYIFQADLHELFYVPAGGTFFSFVFAFSGLCALNKRRLNRTLKGKYLRGTRLFSPREYVRKMKKADGFGIKVLPVEEEEEYRDK